MSSVEASILGFRPKEDLDYQKKLKAHVACNEAGIDPPKELDKYFGGEGIDNDLESPLEVDLPTTEWSDDDRMQDGYELKTKDIPKGVETIRFVVSYD